MLKNLLFILFFLFTGVCASNAPDRTKAWRYHPEGRLDPLPVVEVPGDLHDPSQPVDLSSLMKQNQSSDAILDNPRQELSHDVSTPSTDAVLTWLAPAGWRPTLPPRSAPRPPEQVVSSEMQIPELADIQPGEYAMEVEDNNRLKVRYNNDHEFVVRFGPEGNLAIAEKWDGSLSIYGFSIQTKPGRNTTFVEFGFSRDQIIQIIEGAWEQYKDINARRISFAVPITMLGDMHCLLGVRITGHFKTLTIANCRFI